MRKGFITASLIIMLSITFLSSAECGIWDPFHTKEEKITMWKSLWDSHPTANYTSIGKTYAGNDIWLFMAGNSTGGRILLDGEMHGIEDKGSELLFLIAEWLLESGDPEAIRILEWNHILFIPQLNDQDKRGNANTEISPYGVDLNRNFENGWLLVSPNTDTFGGTEPLSEPETQVLINAFLTYKPTFYINMHCGAGPYAAYYRNSNITLTQKVIALTNELCSSWGISPYPNPSLGSQGFAIGDAIDLGIESAWLIETVGIDTAWRHLPEHWDELVDTFLPKCLALFIAMAESCSSAPSPLEILEINQHPGGNLVTSHIPITISAIFESSTSIKQAILKYYNGTQTEYKIYMTISEENKFTGQIPNMPDGTIVTYTITTNDLLGNTLSSESHYYQTTDAIIPEFSSSIMLIILTISSLFVIISKKYLKTRKIK